MQIKISTTPELIEIEVTNNQSVVYEVLNLAQAVALLRELARAKEILAKIIIEKVKDV